MMSGFPRLVRWMAPLRLALVGTALALVVLRPEPGTRPVYAGWELVPTLIVPTLVPIIFMVLLLDAIMSAVFLSSYPKERRRYRSLIGISLAAALVLLAWWWPYFGRFLR